MNVIISPKEKARRSRRSIINVIRELFPVKKPPECLGHTNEGDPANGYDYDCAYDNPNTDCDNCLAAYHTRGGSIHPETGKRTNGIIAWILYGESRAMG